MGPRFPSAHRRIPPANIFPTRRDLQNIQKDEIREKLEHLVPLRCQGTVYSYGYGRCLRMPLHQVPVQIRLQRSKLIKQNQQDLHAQRQFAIFGEGPDPTWRTQFARYDVNESVACPYPADTCAFCNDPPLKAMKYLLGLIPNPENSKSLKEGQHFDGSMSSSCANETFGEAVSNFDTTYTDRGLQVSKDKALARAKKVRKQKEQKGETSMAMSKDKALAKAQTVRRKLKQNDTDKSQQIQPTLGNQMKADAPNNETKIDQTSKKNLKLIAGASEVLDLIVIPMHAIRKDIRYLEGLLKDANDANEDTHKNINQCKTFLNIDKYPLALDLYLGNNKIEQLQSEESAQKGSTMDIKQIRFHEVDKQVDRMDTLMEFEQSKKNLREMKRTSEEKYMKTTRDLKSYIKSLREQEQHLHELRDKFIKYCNDNDEEWQAKILEEERKILEMPYEPPSPEDMARKEYLLKRTAADIKREKRVIRKKEEEAYEEEAELSKEIQKKTNQDFLTHMELRREVGERQKVEYCQSVCIEKASVDMSLMKDKQKCLRKLNRKWEKLQKNDEKNAKRIQKKNIRKAKRSEMYRRFLKRVQVHPVDRLLDVAKRQRDFARQKLSRLKVKAVSDLTRLQNSLVHMKYACLNSRASFWIRTKYGLGKSHISKARRVIIEFVAPKLQRSAKAIKRGQKATSKALNKVYAGYKKIMNPKPRKSPIFFRFRHSVFGNRVYGKNFVARTFNSVCLAMNFRKVRLLDFRARYEKRTGDLDWEDTPLVISLGTDRETYRRLNNIDKERCGIPLRRLLRGKGFKENGRVAYEWSKQNPAYAPRFYTDLDYQLGRHPTQMEIKFMEKKTLDFRTNNIIRTVKGDEVYKRWLHDNYVTDDDSSEDSDTSTDSSSSPERSSYSSKSQSGKSQRHSSSDSEQSSSDSISTTDSDGDTTSYSSSSSDPSSPIEDHNRRKKSSHQMSQHSSRKNTRKTEHDGRTYETRRRKRPPSIRPDGKSYLERKADEYDSSSDSPKQPTHRKKLPVTEHDSGILYDQNYTSYDESSSEPLWKPNYEYRDKIDHTSSDSSSQDSSSSQSYTSRKRLPRDISKYSYNSHMNRIYNTMSKDSKERWCALRRKFGRKSTSFSSSKSSLKKEESVNKKKMKDSASNRFLPGNIFKRFYSSILPSKSSLNKTKERKGKLQKGSKGKLFSRGRSSKTRAHKTKYIKNETPMSGRKKSNVYKRKRGLVVSKVLYKNKRKNRKTNKWKKSKDSKAEKEKRVSKRGKRNKGKKLVAAMVKRFFSRKGRGKGKKTKSKSEEPKFELQKKQFWRKRRSKSEEPKVDKRKIIFKHERRNKSEEPNIDKSKSFFRRKTRSQSEEPKIKKWKKFFGRKTRSKSEEPKVEKRKSIFRRKKRSQSEEPKIKKLKKFFGRKTRSKSEEPKVDKRKRIFRRKKRSQSEEPKIKKWKKFFGRKTRSKSEEPKVDKRKRIFRRKKRSQSEEPKIKKWKKFFGRKTRSKSEEPYVIKWKTIFRRKTRSQSEEPKLEKPKSIFRRKKRSKIEEPNIKNWKKFFRRKRRSQSEEPNVDKRKSIFRRKRRSKSEEPKVDKRKRFIRRKRSKSIEPKVDKWKSFFRRKRKSKSEEPKVDKRNNNFRRKRRSKSEESKSTMIKRFFNRKNRSRSETPKASTKRRLSSSKDTDTKHASEGWLKKFFRRNRKMSKSDSAGKSNQWSKNIDFYDESTRIPRESLENDSAFINHYRHRQKSRDHSNWARHRYNRHRKSDKHYMSRRVDNSSPSYRNMTRRVPSRILSRSPNRFRHHSNEYEKKRNSQADKFERDSPRNLYYHRNDKKYSSSSESTDTDQKMPSKTNSSKVSEERIPLHKKVATFLRRITRENRTPITSASNETSGDKWAHRKRFLRANISPITSSSSESNEDSRAFRRKFPRGKRSPITSGSSESSGGTQQNRRKFPFENRSPITSDSSTSSEEIWPQRSQIQHGKRTPVSSSSSETSVETRQRRTIFPRGDRSPVPSGSSEQALHQRRIFSRVDRPPVTSGSSSSSDETQPHRMKFHQRNRMIETSSSSETSEEKRPMHIQFLRRNITPVTSSSSDSTEETGPQRTKVTNLKRRFRRRKRTHVNTESSEANKLKRTAHGKVAEMFRRLIRRKVTPVTNGSKETGKVTRSAVEKIAKLFRRLRRENSPPTASGSSQTSELTRSTEGKLVNFFRRLRGGKRTPEASGSSETREEKQPARRKIADFFRRLRRGKETSATK